MLYEVRCRSAAISLAIAGSALRMTSSVTGSSFVLTPRLSPRSGARPSWRRCKGRPEKAPWSFRARAPGPAPRFASPPRGLRGETRECKGRALADRGEPDIVDFDRFLRRMMGVAPIVEPVERRPDGAAVLRLDLLSRHGHGEREFLADVAKIEMDPVLRAFPIPESKSGFSRHLLHRPSELPEIGAVEIGVEGADEIVALVGCEHAERREMRGIERNDHLGYVQLACDRHHVQRSRAARGDQGEVARIVALGDRDLAHGERHLGYRDIDDRLRRQGQAHLQRTGAPLQDPPRPALA